jgi:hypothetical protein
MYFVKHYSEKVYKCNKNIPDLEIFLFGIYLNVISMRYIQNAGGDTSKLAGMSEDRDLVEKASCGASWRS